MLSYFFLPLGDSTYILRNKSQVSAVGQKMGIFGDWSVKQRLWKLRETILVSLLLEQLFLFYFYFFKIKDGLVHNISSKENV